MLAADRTGLSPLHKAVILGHTEIALYLGNEYKETLNLKDNVRKSRNRTECILVKKKKYKICHKLANFNSIQLDLN